jgi:hypothetical protein
MAEEEDNELTELDPLPNDPYPWAADADERRRAFVLDRLPVGEVEPQMIVGVLDEIYKWLRDGTAPAADGRKPVHLRPVR